MRKLSSREQEKTQHVSLQTLFGQSKKFSTSTEKNPLDLHDRIVYPILQQSCSMQ